MSSAFVAMSRFAVVSDTVEEVKAAFRSRPGLVEQAEGFLRLDVISPEEAPEEIWLITYWRDRESFLRWHHSPAHKASHRFIPRGLKLDRRRTGITFFEHVTD